MTNATTIAKGTKVRFVFDHLFQVVSFTGTALSQADDWVIFSVPKPVREMPWYPVKHDDGTPFNAIKIPIAAVTRAISNGTAIRIN